MFTHFPLTVWLATITGLIAIVAVDLVVIARRKRTVTFRDALMWVAAYVSLAVLFAVALLLFAPGPSGSQFIAGYITEYTLSVDNLFVFVIIMSRFSVPTIAQDRALYIGILGSLLLRAIFILAGAGVLALANWVFYPLGALLLYTAVRLMIGGDETTDFRENGMVRLLARIVHTTRDYDGAKIVTRAGGRRMATPLLIVIGSIAIANVVFALDSLPAIFGLTQDAYIIVTANAFALMGLRQLFFLVGDLLNRLTYLNIGLAAILAFIGVKLTLEALHGSHVDAIGSVRLPVIGTTMSLIFIVTVLAVTTAASLAAPSVKRRFSRWLTVPQPGDNVGPPDSVDDS